MEKDIKLSDIHSYIKSLQEAHTEVEAKEKALKKAKEEEKKLSQKVLPDLLLPAGLPFLGFKDGSRIEIEEKLEASIKDIAKLKTFLAERGESDILCTQISVKALQEKDLMWLLTKLDEKGYSAKATYSIHPSTLKAYLRDLFDEEDEQQKDLHLNDFFHIYQYYTTKLIPPPLS